METAKYCSDFVLHLLLDIATAVVDDPVSDIVCCKGSNFKLFIINCCSIFWLSIFLEADNSGHIDGSTSLRLDIIGHNAADAEDLVLAASDGFLAATSAAAEG